MRCPTGRKLFEKYGDSIVAMDFPGDNALYQKLREHEKACIKCKRVSGKKWYQLTPKELYVEKES